MSLQEVENMTLAQKRMTAMVMETTAEDVEAHRAKVAIAEAEAEAAAAAAASAKEDAEMEQSDDEDAVAAARAKQIDEARHKAIATVQAIQANATGPMKIRTDYVPKRALIFNSSKPYFF